MARGRGRSRDMSRSSDILDRSPRESSCSWRKYFNSSLEKDQTRKDEDTAKKLTAESRKPEKKELISDEEKTKRRLSLISEYFNQSPSMNILQIKPEGKTRLQSSKPGFTQNPRTKYKTNNQN